MGRYAAKEWDQFLHGTDVVRADRCRRAPATPGQGDFIIRGLLGADPSSGAIEIGQAMPVDATVQFHVRDAVSAGKDLRLAVERAAAEAPGRPVGALLFACNTRGRRMFGTADHEPLTISELLGGIPLAGSFAAGEIEGGPVWWSSRYAAWGWWVVVHCRANSVGVSWPWAVSGLLAL